MVFLPDLWLPILLSAVFVFVASSIIHMVLPYHRNEYRRLPEEDNVLAALRGVSPGFYSFPHAPTPKDMASPAVIEKYKQGPVGSMTVIPNGPPSMPKFLGMWFGFCLLVGIFVAYLTGRTLGPGTEYLHVFRVAGTAAFLAYAVGEIPNMIWKGQPASMTLKHIFDGLIYALLTAGVFGWLWPR